MAKSASTLAKAHDLESATEYFDYIVSSVINGQRQQAYELFVAMDMPGRAGFWDYIRAGYSAEQVSDVTVCITSRI